MTTIDWKQTGKRTYEAPYTKTRWTIVVSFGEGAWDWRLNDPLRLYPAGAGPYDTADAAMRAAEHWLDAQRKETT